MPLLPIVTTIISLTTSPWRQQEEPTVEQAIAQFDRLPQDSPPSALIADASVRTLLLHHGFAYMRLQEYLRTGKNPRGRLAACLILHLGGFDEFLHAATHDADPLVQNYARSVLRRPISTQGSPPAAPYTVDETLRPALEEITGCTMTFSPEEQALLLRNLSREISSETPIEAGAATSRRLTC